MYFIDICISRSLLISPFFFPLKNKILKILVGDGAEQILKVAWLKSKSERFDDALENQHVTGNMKDAFLFVSVLLSWLVEQADKDRVIQQLRADHEPLHLVSDVDRHVAFGDRLRARGTARQRDLERAERLRATWASACCFRGFRPQETVLRGVGDARKTAN